jgi:hypothetical protein
MLNGQVKGEVEDMPEPNATVNDALGDRGGNTDTGQVLPAGSARVRALADLDTDWNSYGSDPVSPAAIHAAECLLRTAEARLGRQQAEPWAVGALPDGGVSLIWRPALNELVVDVADDGTLGCVYVWLEKTIFQLPSWIARPKPRSPPVLTS